MPAKRIRALFVTLLFTAAMSVGCGDLFEGSATPASAATASAFDKDSTADGRTPASLEQTAQVGGSRDPAPDATTSGSFTPSGQPPASQAPALRTIRLAVNGDSIANGANPAGSINEAEYVSFRGPLYRALVQRGLTVDVIGTRSTPVRDDLAPPLHSAQGGARLDTPQGGIVSISQLMDQLKAAHPHGPYDDLVYVLEGGTNNALVDSPEVVAAKWDALIRKQQELFPGSWLVMVGMVPASWINAAYFSAVNGVLANADRGGRVIDARLGEAGLNSSDYVDGTHLSMSGAAKAGNWMANRFLSRIN